MKRNDAEVKPEKKKKVKKAWRFYRSNLSTVVWDPDNETALADFSAGHFTTKSKKVADILRGKGYPEIGLKDTAPPNIIVNQPVHVLKEGMDVPLMGKGINEKVGQTRMDSVTEKMQPPKMVEE